MEGRLAISPPQTEEGMKVVMVGAGGNIGSHLTPHLARMPGVQEVTLIDPGVYEAKDVWGQAITPREVGKPKAVVQARRLWDIRPSLRVRPIVEPVERVPLGLLRGDVILAGLDSRRARQVLNEAAWRLNVPLIDAGVGSGLVARVNVYVPGTASPCLECAWSEKDYEQLEQSYPCQGKAAQAAATNAPSALGALAASLEALECRKLLAGLTERVLGSRQVMLDATFHKHYVTTFSRNPRCRFDHEVFTVRQLPYTATLSVQDVLALDPAAPGDDDGRAWFGVAGSHFVRALCCTACRRNRSLLRLEASLRPAELKCRRCGGAMTASGFDRLDHLDPSALPARVLSRSLCSLGVREHDVISVVSAQGAKHYELVSGAVSGARSRPADNNGVVDG
jgi:molybdopterin/thiamine biosynthesis adenylyltransferase